LLALSLAPILSHPAQERRLPDVASRQFSYDGAQLGKWYEAYGIDNELEARRRRPQLSEAGMTRHHNDAVKVSGNFAATYTVVGPGSATATTTTSLVNIETDVGLRFTATGFGVLRDSLNNAAGSVGSVIYELAVLNSSGTVVSGPVTGTDTGINGQFVSVADPSGHFVREFTLRIRRTVALTQLAKGGETYTATGTIALLVDV
jgi:hypothetical protein